MRYLAEAESDRALTPLQAAACTYRIAAKATRGAKSTEPANRPQPSGRFHAAGLRQRARLQPACGSTLWRPSAQGARTPVPLYHPPGDCQRTAETQSRRPSRAAAQEPLPRRHHPYRDVAVGVHAALSRIGPASAAASDSLPWRARTPRQVACCDRSQSSRSRQPSTQSPRTCAGLASAHELGVPAETRIRYRYRTLPKLWRPPEDHRRDRRSRADCQDPHPPALTRPRTAQVTGAASRSVPSGLIAHSSSPSIALNPQADDPARAGTRASGKTAPIWSACSR